MRPNSNTPHPATSPPEPRSRAHICQVLTSLSQQHAARTITVCGHRRRTGKQVAADVAALGGSFRVLLGVQEGDRVCILGLNSDYYCDALLAVTLVGGIAAPLNHRWSAEETISAVQSISPVALVVDDSLVHLWGPLRTAAPTLRHAVTITTLESDNNNPVNTGGNAALSNSTVAAPVRDGSVVTWRELMEQDHSPERGNSSTVLAQSALCWANREPASPALICFTSGTTGVPKGAVLSHDALVVQSLSKLAVVRYTSQDVFLHVAPLCHIGGISSLLAMLMAGGTSIVEAKFDAKAFPGLVRQHRVSALIAVPAMLADVINTAEQGLVLPSVTTLLVGGGAMDPDLQSKVMSLCPHTDLWTAYGMTEAASSITFLCLRSRGTGAAWGKGQGTEQGATCQPRGVEGATCVGYPAPHVEVRVGDGGGEGGAQVLSDHGRVRPGEVLTRGAHVTSGYWGNPGATQEAVSGDGWLRTGDAGVLDSTGCLWLMGRIKDMVKTGGENVFATEVEGVLIRHPGIQEAAVVGIPDDKLGEAMSVLLKLKKGWSWGEAMALPGSQCLGSVSLQSFCRSQGLSRFKVPRAFSVLSPGVEMPRTSTGKLKKDAIKIIVLQALFKCRQEAKARL